MTRTSSILAALLMLSGFAAVAEAQTEEPCESCHEDTVIEPSAHPDLVCVDCHVNVPPEHEDDDLEPLTDEESCGDCHRRPHRDGTRSVHADEASCADCHGPAHGLHLVAEPESAMSPVNQIQYCGDCHDEPASLVDDYLASEHGHALLKSGLVSAPSCSSCHGTHRMLGAENSRDPTHWSNSPETCGTCHALLLEEWQAHSAHGLGWQDENEEVPVCVDCHSSHDVADPGTDASRLASAENCGSCHEEQMRTYSEGFHGKAIDLGMARSANCADCHTSHRNLPADDPESSVHPDNLVATCGTCHEGISASFTGFDPHNDPTDPDDNFAVYVIWVFMVGLLIGVFSFFGIHDALWLQRTVVGLLRGEYQKPAEDERGRYVRRFRKSSVWTHVAIVITFLLLAMTGLPLRFADAAWAQALINLLGGLESARVIHRIAAIGTFGYAIFHLGLLFVKIAVRRERGMLWGPNSLVPQPQDVKDLWSNLRHFLYLGERTQGDRWNYIEKFDYLAVFWGVLIIGMSGLMLWFPAFFTTFLPGWTINAAYIVHSDEALLATGFIFIFHFFHTHLRPESFPMDIVIFTGKVPLERFREERPLEYQRLVENGELDDYLVDAPTDAERRNAYVFGSLALFVGIALAIGIIWALLTS